MVTTLLSVPLTSVTLLFVKVFKVGIPSAVKVISTLPAISGASVP